MSEPVHLAMEQLKLKELKLPYCDNRVKCIKLYISNELDYKVVQIYGFNTSGGLILLQAE